MAYRNTIFRTLHPSQLDYEFLSLGKLPGVVIKLLFWQLNSIREQKITLMEDFQVVRHPKQLVLAATYIHIHTLYPNQHNQTHNPNCCEYEHRVITLCICRIIGIQFISMCKCDTEKVCFASYWSHRRSLSVARFQDL